MQVVCPKCEHIGELSFRTILIDDIVADIQHIDIGYINGRFCPLTRKELYQIPGVFGMIKKRNEKIEQEALEELDQIDNKDDFINSLRGN